ncbi:MAG: BON domain-containing protein [Gammaproteobacteria bacterium]|nr:BON domain-containing protein [Gammaproteobacteria bacterium]MCZ6893350.1 BON domain-containing protein [Gammaproteobacteria bacterium]
MKKTPFPEIFKRASILLIAVTLVTISGCAGILLGGAATSAVVANDPRTTGTFVEDQAIEVKAYSSLRANNDIKEQTHIGVTSYNQVVLLTGQAPTEDLRSQVVEIVSGIAKVRHIHNEVTIAAPNSMMSRTNDGLLTTKVKTKMFATADLNATKIKVVSEAGVVYLMGLVSAAEGDLAAEIASRTGGVQRVVKLFEAQ